MSIASDEARNRYPHFEGFLGVEEMYRDAYIAGRTAGPTDVEIEAAASEIESVSDDHRAQHADGHYVSCSCGFPVSCMEEFDMHWDKEMAKAALLAARRAVMG